MIFASLRFPIAHARTIGALLWVPAAVLTALAMILLKIYFTMLADYLSSGDVRIASLTAGLMAIGVFIALFVAVIGGARVARLVCYGAKHARRGRQGWAVEARLYAGLLRYLLAVAIVIVGSTILTKAIVLAGIGNILLIERLLWALVLTAISVFAVRCGFLGPALAVFERKRILRRAWELSRGHFWTLTVLMAVLLVIPAVIVQALGELAIERLASPPLAGPMLLLVGARWLAQNDIGLLAIAVTLSASSTLSLTLATIGSCLAYRSLVEAP
jgi:hypothetical protein